MKPQKQKTIKNIVEYTGVGLHTGEKVQLRFKPAEPDQGVVFTRVDIPGSPRIPAKVECLQHKLRRTALTYGGAEVYTTEHLLAVLYGLGIDNIEVEINGIEIPGADGSALPYLILLKEKAGIVEQEKEKKFFAVKEPILVSEEDTALLALPSKGVLRISYTLDYEPHFSVQTLYFKLTQEEFETQIAPARTFCLSQEVEALQKAGLGKGANHENTLVITPDGVYKNTLRFPDEYVRHKILDLLGDLYLTGLHISACILANKSGHTLNARLTRLIAKAYQNS